MRLKRPVLWAMVVPALAFGGALVLVAALAARTLGERDAAVREGVLARAGHVLEEGLRESGPEGAEAVLGAFLAENTSSVSGIEVSGPAGRILSAGHESRWAVEIPASLGREWRDQAFPQGGGGRGPSGGQGNRSSMQGFGMQGRGSPPFKLRLFAAPALGSVPGLATAIVAGSAAAALGLAGLAFAAGRGIEERRRREAAEAEGQRLQSIALAGSGLAHRLRNPLAVIKGTAQMLETHLTESQRQRAERIVSASERMETILSRLLDFARPIAPQSANFDLATLVSEVTTRIPGPIEVHSGGAFSVQADREHVESILEEFLANARVFDPSGTIDVSIRRDRERLVVEVADRGPGLTLDAVSAFEPYVTTRPEGTGLGLAIVKSLARANGGAVSLAGRPGGGCVASLILPKGEA